MTDPAEKPSYEELDIRRGLIEVAACSGNTHQAARNLAADDDATPIPQKTLWYWANRSHVETYEELRAKALPAINALASEQHMALARQQMEASQTAAAEVAKRIPSMEDKDLVNAMGKFDIGSGIHTEKAQLLSGHEAPSGERTVEELLRGLAGKGLSLGEKVVEESEGKRVSVERVATID